MKTSNQFAAVVAAGAFALSVAGSAFAAVPAPAAPAAHEMEACVGVVKDNPSEAVMVEKGVCAKIGGTVSEAAAPAAQ